MTNFTQVSFDLISEMKKSSDADQVCSILAGASDVFGYDTFVIAAAPVRSQDNLQDRLTLGRLPAQWSERYEECSYIHHDPVVAHTRRMNGLFRWSDAPAGRDERLARTIMGEASEIGLRDGYCIPIQDLTCTRIVSFGGARLAKESSIGSAIVESRGIATAGECRTPTPMRRGRTRSLSATRKTIVAPPASRMPVPERRDEREPSPTRPGRPRRRRHYGTSHANGR